VLRYDLYGRGLSDRPTIPYNEGLFDRQILDLLKALSINDKIDLIGVSMGGPISATFANRHAMKVRSLTLIDPGYQTGRKAPLRLRIPVLGELVMKTVVAPWLPASQLRDFHNPEQFSDWPEKFRQQMRYKGFRRALLSTIRLYAGRDTRTDYAQVGRSQLPVLLIWGEGDKAVSARIHDSIQLLIPQATSHVIKAAAHLPHLERPQDVNPILLSFLQNGYR
jgi:pimeloyl-ACP methyl ester carboxylesterase